MHELGRFIEYILKNQLRLGVIGCGDLVVDRLKSNYGACYRAVVNHHDGTIRHGTWFTEGHLRQDRRFPLRVY